MQLILDSIVGLLEGGLKYAAVKYLAQYLAHSAGSVQKMLDGADYLGKLIVLSLQLECYLEWQVFTGTIPT